MTSEAASLLGKRSYRVHFECLGIERIREIARENGKNLPCHFFGIFGVAKQPTWICLTEMRKAHDSLLESSTTELDGVKGCNFMTTWGDGCFEVHRDIGNSSELVQIRIELVVA